MSDDSQKCYDMFFQDAMHLLNDHQLPVELVAGTLMAIAMRLYRTSLSSDGFSEMLQSILESEKDVKSYFDDEEETLH